MLWKAIYGEKAFTTTCFRVNDWVKHILKKRLIAKLTHTNHRCHRACQSLCQQANTPSRIARAWNA